MRHWRDEQLEPSEELVNGCADFAALNDRRRDGARRQRAAYRGELEQGRISSVLSTSNPAPVTADTRFQVASISKVFTALAVVKLAAEGQLDLDRDIEAYLQGWSLPRTYQGPRRDVTLRLLLSHQAGTTVHGFEGYLRDGSALPSLHAILSGRAPANSPAVVVDQIPGGEVRYSGGGFMVIQALLEESGGEPFAQRVGDSVLKPLRMTHSSYAAPPEKMFAEGHDENGNVIPGGWRRYPEMAAASLWSTPRDLARMMIDVAAAYQGASRKLLSPSWARAMLTPRNETFGLGMMLVSEGKDLLFQHGGSNSGYRCNFIMNATRGRGVVVLTNADNGGRLMRDVVLRVAEAYGWPEFNETTLK
jgi:CubicO group peptidase (beta-lactamase class C family)